jgi:hypothetical protein
MHSYTTYPGKFLCKECKIEVKSMRVYPNTGEATWLCLNKHVSKVQLYKVGYKKKKNDE